MPVDEESEGKLGDVGRDQQHQHRLQALPPAFAAARFRQTDPIAEGEEEAREGDEVNKVADDLLG